MISIDTGALVAIVGLVAIAFMVYVIVDHTTPAEGTISYRDGERDGFNAGVRKGALLERERIVKLLKSDDARKTCGCTGVWRVADKLAAGGWKLPEQERPMNQTRKP